MDFAIVRHFLTRWAASFGLFYSPLGIRDFLKLEWNALLYPARSWNRRARAALTVAAASEPRPKAATVRDQAQPRAE